MDPGLLWSAGRTTARTLTLGLSVLTFVASSNAQESSSAVLYGRINVGLEHVDASRSATDLSITRLSNYRSVFGFRGNEDLGSGLKVIWQIETAFSLDTGSSTGIGSRDSHVGLQGGFGTVFGGVWTLPYTSSTSGFDPFYVTTAGYMSIMGNGSASNTNHLIDTHSFDRRQQNVLQYWTPAWSGFSARLAYGVNDAETTASGGKPSLLSGSVEYEIAGLLLTAAHERHKEYQARNTTDTASKIGAAYRFGPARIAAVVERLTYETATGDLKRNSWYVSGTYDVGLGKLNAGYSHANDGTGSATETVGFFRSGPDTGSSQVTVGYEHALSKRTALFAFYSRINNESAALYDFAINQLGIKAGARPSVVSLGMRHNF